MMYFYVSTLSRKKVYHKDGCPYISKIGSKYKRKINPDAKRYQDWRECKYCGGTRGYARVFHKRPYRHSIEKKCRCYWEHGTDNLYISTKLGFWKIYLKHDPFSRRWLLFHANHYDREKSINQMMHSAYHRQRDVGPTDNIDSIVSYIVSHDKNKEIASYDYRKLPKKTKQQKKYYESAKKKARREYAEHMNQLFNSIKKPRE